MEKGAVPGAFFIRAKNRRLIKANKYPGTLFTGATSIIFRVHRILLMH